MRSKFLLAALVVPVLSTINAPLSTASAGSTMNATNHHAWSANTGWVDFRAEHPDAGDGFRFGEFSCSGYLWSPNIGWINCGNGSPSNGIAYANNNHTDFGVNHYGTGDLYGLAWAPNVGWINFDWATLDSGNPNRPRVDLGTGEFSGYAWSANCGWINLGIGRLKTDRMDITDTDSDGISDVYELQYTGSLTNMTAGSDLDSDGFNDKAEYMAITNPLDPESYLKITKIEQLNQDGTATKLTWVSAPIRRYVIERVSELGGTNQWQPSALDPASFDAEVSGFSTARTTYDTPSPTRFFRIQAVIPLQP